MAIVNGGAGIGKAIAPVMAQEGAAVAVRDVYEPQAEEAAKVVVFLASDDSSWLTGEITDINGEQFMDWRATNPSGFHRPTHPESRESPCRLIPK